VLGHFLDTFDGFGFEGIFARSSGHITEPWNSLKHVSSSVPRIRFYQTCAWIAIRLPRVQGDPRLNDIDGPFKGYIRNGTKNRVLYDREILQRRCIPEKHYLGPKKKFFELRTLLRLFVFSNVDARAHGGMEAPFYTSILYLARFLAEALGVFMETFPESDCVVTSKGRDHIAFLRGPA
jgi:hypothetical protein